MIAAVSPSHTSYEETHNTLKYANRAKEIKVKVKANVQRIDVKKKKMPARSKLRKEEISEEDDQERRITYSPRKFKTSSASKKRKSTSPDSSAKKPRTMLKQRSKPRRTERTRTMSVTSASSPSGRRRRSSRSPAISSPTVASPCAAPSPVASKSALGNTVDDRMMACFQKHLTRLRKERNSTSPAVPRNTKVRTVSEDTDAMDVVAHSSENEQSSPAMPEAPCLLLLVVRGKSQFQRLRQKSSLQVMPRSESLSSREKLGSWRVSIKR